MDRGGGIGRPFGAGVSLGMFAGLVIGSLITLWLGEALFAIVRRVFERVFVRRERISFELLLQ